MTFKEGVKGAVFVRSEGFDYAIHIDGVEIAAHLFGNIQIAEQMEKRRGCIVNGLYVDLRAGGALYLLLRSSNNELSAFLLVDIPVVRIFKPEEEHGEHDRARIVAIAYSYRTISYLKHAAFFGVVPKFAALRSFTLVLLFAHDTTPSMFVSGSPWSR